MNDKQTANAVAADLLSALNQYGKGAALGRMTQQEVAVMFGAVLATTLAGKIHKLRAVDNLDALHGTVLEAIEQDISAQVEIATALYEQTRGIKEVAHGIN